MADFIVRNIRKNIDLVVYDCPLKAHKSLNEFCFRHNKNKADYTIIKRSVVDKKVTDDFLQEL